MRARCGGWWAGVVLGTALVVVITGVASVKPAASAGKALPVIAFGRAQDVAVMGADGTNEITVAKQASGVKGAPAWSPDGLKLAFHADRGDGFDVYVVDSVTRRFTRLTNSEGDDRNPAWSPDGTRIAFDSTRDGTRGIYVMNADGRGQTGLTTGAASLAPTWSPDGTRIAFTQKVARDGASTQEIFVVSAAGGNLTQLTDGGSESHLSAEPRWSPDGKLIAFQSDREGSLDLYLMRADGSGEPRRLTTDDAKDQHPAWSPDGKQIVFASDRDGDLEIFVTDGKSERQLTKNESPDTQPDWRPNLGPAAPPTTTVPGTPSASPDATTPAAPSEPGAPSEPPITMTNVPSGKCTFYDRSGCEAPSGGGGDHTFYERFFEQGG